MNQVMKCGDCGAALEPKLRDGMLFIDHRCNEAEEREMLLEVARCGVAYERPGRYVEVQIAGGLWAQLQEWRKRCTDTEERK